MTGQRATKGDNLFHVVLRGALVPAAASGVVATVLLAVLRGSSGLVGAAIGVAIALAFFVSGLAVVGRFVRDRTDPMLFMAVGMAVYLAQVGALLGVLVLARSVHTFDSTSAGVAMLVTVVAWQIAQVVTWRRARVPIYDERLDDERPSSGTEQP